MNKKIRTVLLTLLLAFTTVLFGNVFADSLAGSITDGKINVNKVASKNIGTQGNETYGRKANVTLSVTGTEFTTSSSLDVVLVIDRSGSMNDKASRNDTQTKMQATKASAITLVTNLFANNTANRTVVNMGIVTFGSDVIENDGARFNPNRLTSESLSSNAATISGMINNIPDSVGERGDNLGSQGTNIQSGLERAKSLLANSTAKNKVVILLTDGKPTYFNYDGERYGTGSDDDSVCIERNGNRCTTWKKPSEAAEEEAAAIKVAGATIYTIGFGLGNDTTTTTFLQNVASGADKAYLADDAQELLDNFSDIVKSITTIANNVVVEDIVPAGFEIDEDAIKSTYGDAVSITYNEDGTTKIVWNIGTLTVTNDPSLTYQVTAKDDYYGGMYTNASAILTGTAVEGNPSYPSGDIEEEFPMPVVAIPMKTNNDNYTAKLGETLTVGADKGILVNDSSIKLAEGENTSVIDEIIVKSASCGDVSDIKVSADGSFEYTPDASCYATSDKVTFDYEVKSTVTINGVEYVVISNTSVITVNLTKDNSEIEDPEVVKTNDNGTTTTSIEGPFNYTIDYTATIENHIGTTIITIVDKLPYELDETKNNVLNGGSYDATNKTITWIETINDVNSYENKNNEVHVVKHITVYYENVPTDVDVIENKASVTTNINNTPVEDTEETEVVRGNLVVNYVDNLGNPLAATITSSGLVDSDYTTDASDKITYNNEEYVLVATKVNGESIAKTNNYSGKYVLGTTTVTYVYYKVTGEIDDQTTIVKEGTDKVVTSDSEFNYTITYNSSIDEYIGNATLTIVDKLPYAIDTTKSYDLDGGTYDATNKTITWVIDYKDINTYENGAYPISITKNIKVTFAGIDATKRELVNEVVGTLVTDKSTDKQEDEEITDLEIKGNVIAHYVDVNGTKLSDDVETSDLVGNDYVTSAKAIAGYKLVNVEGNTTGKYIDGTIEVTYIYYKVEGNVENNTITKEGTGEVFSVNDKFNYTITYNTTITDYIGNAVVTIVDTLPYEIDEANSNLNGGIYDAANKTITWVESIEDIDTNVYGDKDITITKEISVVYVGLEPTVREVTNKVVGTLKTDLGETPTEDEKDTAVKVYGTVTAHYVTTDGVSLSNDVVMRDLVGNEYLTEEKEFTDYELVEIIGNKAGKYTVEPIEVTYVYYKETGEITNNEVEKTGNEVITSKEDKFNYTINYQTEINNYIGNATVTVIDYLPLAIDLTQSDLNGGTYDKDNLTITWVINYNDIDTYNNGVYKITVTKELVLVYEEIDPTIDKITNRVETQVRTNITEDKDDDEFDTEVDIEGTVKVMYVDDAGNELADMITMTGKVGTEYTTEEKEFDDYVLVLVEGEKAGKYVEGETIVTYIYTQIGKGGDVEVLPPQTGVNSSSLPFNVVGSLLLGLFLVFKKFI